MRLHAIIPVKALERAKSRLAGTLLPAERRTLVLEMLDRVLVALSDPGAAVTATWVVSADPVALARGAARGALPLLDRAGELNEALEQARAVVWSAEADALLVLPADVPLVTPADIAALWSFLAAGADVALAADAAGTGTNALAMRRGADVPFSFGLESVARHQARAAALGFTVRRYSSPTIALDIDAPVSLARYRTIVPAQTSRAVG